MIINRMGRTIVVVFFHMLLLVAGMPILSAATSNTLSTGNWTDGGNWDNGVPGSTDDANINHNLVINTNISTTQGDYVFNSPCIDNPGGPAYSLSISGNGSNEGLVDINANVTFEGSLTVSSKGRLVIRSGDTLRVGATTFANGSFVDIEAGGVLIVNGNLTNNNNSTGINVNGQIIVIGNVSGGNGSAITGTGGLSATGTISTSGSGVIFGSGADCSTPPCTAGNSTLPIELVGFEARYNGSVITVNWETSSEINNDYFTLERSENAIDFQVIHTEIGCGNCNYTNAYTFSDYPEKNASYYYRLKQTDFNGEFSYSPLIAVNFNLIIDAFKVYPNPFTEQIMISTNGIKYGGTVKVVNDLGRIVYQSSVDDISRETVKLGNLQAGVYFLILEGVNFSSTQRMIKL